MVHYNRERLRLALRLATLYPIGLHGDLVEARHRSSRLPVPDTAERQQVFHPQLATSLPLLREQPRTRQRAKCVPVSR